MANNVVRMEPQQLGLELFFNPPTERANSYSRTLDIYDAALKYVWNCPILKEGEKPTPITRTYEYNGMQIESTIKPAYIQDRKGEWKHVFPGEREEIVEDALRKLAVDGQAVMIDDNAGVRFTLYQLAQELAKQGHTLNISQIKEALTVCNEAHLTIKQISRGPGDDDEEISLSANLFQTLGLKTRKDWEKHGNKAQAFVAFNPLVTRAILRGGFRQINYDTCMTYRRRLARWFHKRLAMRYRQAHATKPYTIGHHTVSRDSGLESYARLRKAIEMVELALKEMKERDVLKDYDVQRKYEGRPANRITDAKYVLIPSDSFVAEVKRANALEREVQLQLTKNQLITGPQVRTGS